jgi:hypoxanthine-DNA glycosylase
MTAGLCRIQQTTMKNESPNIVVHEIEPVWNNKSTVLILGTMPSPKSREAGFFYMHPQNRFWKVLPQVFGETLVYANNATQRNKAVEERIAFLYRHQIALWDVLKSCEITGAADSSIKNAVSNDFTQIFSESQIKRVFCTGNTAFLLWNKYCAAKYQSFGITCECLPSTSPANARWNFEKLVAAYRRIEKR